MMVAAAMALGFSGRAEAENVSHSEGFTPPQSSETFSPAPIEFKEEPVIPWGEVAFSPLSVRDALQHFLAQLSILSKTSEKGLAGDYEILYYTLLPFLASHNFGRTVVHSQRRGEPIELTLISPERLKEAKTLQEFSERFRLPLDFEPNQEIIPAKVTISLAYPWAGIPVKVESQEDETLYLVDTSN